MISANNRSANHPRAVHSDACGTLSAKDGGLWQLGAVHYPQAEKVCLGFQQEPLAVYQGDITLSALFTSNGEVTGGQAAIAPAQLKIQVCSDQICLRPEDVILEVPTVVTMGTSINEVGGAQ